MQSLRNWPADWVYRPDTASVVLREAALASTDRYASDGVLVNAICPGPTRSELWMAEGGLLDQSAALAGGQSR